MTVEAFALVVGAEPPVVGMSDLAQYGPGGVLALIALGFTWVMFKRYEQTLDLERVRYEKTLDLERARSARAEDELRELNKTTRDLTMPALTQATLAITEAMKVLRKDHPL